MSTAPMRASDQDRQEAVLALSEAYAEGRLDAEEFEDRQSRALVATYLHDLDPLFADLPGRVAPTSRPAPPPVPPRRGPRGGGAPIAAAALALVVALAFVTGGHALWLLVPMLWFAAASRRRRHWHALHAAHAAQLPRHAPPALIADARRPPRDALGGRRLSGPRIRSARVPAAGRRR